MTKKREGIIKMSDIKSIDNLIKELKIVNEWVVIYDNQIVSHHESQTTALRIAREIYPEQKYSGKIFDLKYVYGEIKPHFPFIHPRKSENSIINRTIDDILQNRREHYLDQWVIINEKGEILSNDKDKEVSIKKAREKYPNGWIGLLYVEEKDEISCSDLFD